MRMFIDNWLRRYFSHPEAKTLLLTIAAIVLVITIFGKLLMPALVSIVIAYLLDWFVKQFERWKIPHVLAVSLATLLFIGTVLTLLLWALPLLWGQLINLFNELPNYFGKGQVWLINLQNHYNNLISAEQIRRVIDTMHAESARFGGKILTISLASIPGVIALIVYAILVPLLIFFFLKDKAIILAWLAKFLPERRQIIKDIWFDINVQIGRYIRGRIAEVFIVSIVTIITFKLMGLDYAFLLGVLFGLSAFVPYIGLVAVTIPVVVVAAMQWGISAHFFYLLLSYFIIVILDGNVLVPLLFAEALQLNPVAIILAILFFGKLWGLWGVFFAIPLASAIKVLMVRWPVLDET